jgi:hypothetical protein
MMEKKYLAMTLVLCLAPVAAVFAQPGLDEMGQARQDLKASFLSAMDFGWIMAALLGITGAVKIYHNWQMGEREITGRVAAWFFAALFMLLAGPFLRALLAI